jgi:hypothetical protein
MSLPRTTFKLHLAPEMERRLTKVCFIISATRKDWISVSDWTSESRPLPDIVSLTPKKYAYFAPLLRRLNSMTAALKWDYAQGERNMYMYRIYNDEKVLSATHTVKVYAGELQNEEEMIEKLLGSVSTSYNHSFPFVGNNIFKNDLVPSTQVEKMF